MHKVNYILLFSFVAIASSLPQITWQGREPGLSISQQIGDGIRNVPIPPPWYFLRNKYYWTTNTGFKTSTEGSRVVNNYNLNGQIAKGYPAPDLNSRFNTIDSKTTTTKIEYVPYTTRRPKYQVPNTFVSPNTSPVTTSTEQVPNQTVFIPTYQTPVSTVIPSTTVNSVTTAQSTYPLPNKQPYGSDPTLTNAHSKPLYTSEYPKILPEITTVIPKLPNFYNNGNQSSGSQLQMGTTESQVLEKENLPEITTVVPKLPTFNTNGDQSSGPQLEIGTTESQVLENEEKDLENLNTVVETTETTLEPLINDNISQTTGPDPLNYANNDTSNKEDIRRNATNDTESHNNNPGLLFSGPQICRKENAYFGVGENHSFYVECKDYQPSVKLCPENYSFDSNVQWPEYPCKQIAIENQPQIQ